jgi:hypothetical protein
MFSLKIFKFNKVRIRLKNVSLDLSTHKGITALFPTFSQIGRRKRRRSKRRRREPQQRDRF